MTESDKSKKENQVLFEQLIMDCVEIISKDIDKNAIRNNIDKMFHLVFQGIENINAEEKYTRDAMSNSLSPSFTFLHLVARFGTVYELERALSLPYDIDCNVDNSDRVSVFQYLSEYIKTEEGVIEKLQLLIDSGANPDTVCSLGSTPLIRAIRSKDTIAFDFLVEHCDVNFTNGFANYPIYEAIISNRDYMLEKLIEKGADINIKKENNSTPVMECILYRSKKLLEIILSYHPDLTDVLSYAQKTADKDKEEDSVEFRMLRLVEQELEYQEKHTSQERFQEIDDTLNFSLR